MKEDGYRTLAGYNLKAFGIPIKLVKPDGQWDWFKVIATYIAIFIGSVLVWAGYYYFFRDYALNSGDMPLWFFHFTTMLLISIMAVGFSIQWTIDWNIEYGVWKREQQEARSIN